MGSAFERELPSAQWPRSAKQLAMQSVTRSMTRGDAWRRTSRGYFVPVMTTAPTTTQRIVDLAPLVPATGAFTDWAAAYVLGVDLLDGLDPESMRPMPITINLGSDLGRLDSEHFRYVRDRLPPDHRETLRGLPVTTPFRTAFDGARFATNLVEAVVFVDQLTHALDIDIATLAAWCAAQGKFPKTRQLESAIMLADPASANAWESRLRMFYVLEAGLTRPLVNRPIFDPTGRFLGTPDLFDPEAGLVTEFDGQDHRARQQHRKDNLREERLEEANLTVCRVDSLDLRRRLALKDRLQSRYSQGLARDHRRDRWTLQQPLWWRRRRAS